ncbi:MAG: hypothetical protein AB8I08_00805 [Sandaracinaceae bacterium]
MRTSRGWMVVGALLLAACDGGRSTVLVDLQTDLRAGIDFQSVRVSMLAGPEASADPVTRSVTRDNDFLEGARVAEFPSLAPGAYTLEVQLLGDGLRNARREVTVEVRTATLVVAVISRACLGVRCPGPGDDDRATECASGRCVAPECTPDRPENCPEAACQGDLDCGGGGGCVVARCLSGECFEAPDDSACASDAYCDGESQACVVLPPLDAGMDGDAGLSDAGLSDAGPTCTPASCADTDPCTNDLCVGDTCTHPPRCTGMTYCLAGTCFPDPSIDFLTTSSPGCIDLGVPHPSGDEYTFRRMTRGRPNAAVQQINEHVSCGLPRENAETYTLDSTGNESFSFYSAALTDCFASIYGRYRIRAEVDGRVSPFDEVTYFNSRCPGIDTCSGARTFCSPCRACTGAQYCAGTAGCAPFPTLNIVTSEGAGCIDLGVSHGTPPAAAFTITGRPGATSTQYNEQVSCGTPESAAEVRVLDGGGRAIDALETGALTDCTASIYGRWEVEVEVDGERSNTVDVVYFNSTCAAVSTCAEAGSSCGGGTG